LAGHFRLTKCPPKAGLWFSGLKKKVLGMLSGRRDDKHLLFLVKYKQKQIPLPHAGSG